MTSENDAALADYAAALEQTTLAAETRRTYLSRVRVYLGWLPTPDALRSVAARDRAVADYHAHLAALGRSPRYTNNAMAALDDFYERRNLGRLAVGRAPVPRSSPHAQSTADRDRRFEAASRLPHARDRLLALLPVHAGLRVGEVVALDVADTRRLLRDRRLRPAVDDWLAERAGWPGAGGDALFLNRRGGRLSVRSAAAVLATVGAVGAAEPVGSVGSVGSVGNASSAKPTEPLPEVRRGALRGGQRERRERVIDAAVRLMAAVDYADLQVKDVADEAGVALGTLYRYFASKDHLFACALMKWGTGFGGRVVHKSGAAAVERVSALYLKAARAFEAEPRVYAVLAQLESSRDERAAEVYADFVRMQNSAFATALAGFSEKERQDIVWVMGAVLAEALHSRMLGLFGMDGVYERIERAAQLILR